MPEILALPPLARRVLLEEGIPVRFFYRNYVADPDLSVIRFDGHPPLVRFGSDSRGIIGVDFVSGHVIHVDDRWGLSITFVNTTVGKFAETARLLAEQFPYGVSRDWLDEAGEAADVMRSIIRSVDVEAATAGTYWPDYADEIDGWLYGLDKVLEWHRARGQVAPAADLEDSGQGKSSETEWRLF